MALEKSTAEDDQTGEMMPRQVLAPRLPRVPGISAPSIREGELCPLPAPCSQEEINQYRSAAVFMKSLADEARAWRDKLPSRYRPAILAVLHGGLQIHVHSLSQVSFDGIRIEGTMDGSPCSLLAHQSTVQMLCYAEEVPPPEEEAPPKRPIGFIWEDNSVEV